jgi:hypothetical protein
VVVCVWDCQPTANKVGNVGAYRYLGWKADTLLAANLQNACLVVQSGPIYICVKRLDRQSNALRVPNQHTPILDSCA